LAPSLVAWVTRRAGLVRLSGQTWLSLSASTKQVMLPSQLSSKLLPAISERPGRAEALLSSQSTSRLGKRSEARPSKASPQLSGLPVGFE
jgi:hypothetical protein